MSMLRELENLLQEITDQGPAKGKPGAQPGRRPAPQQPIEYLEAEIVEAEPVREGVAEHVSHHLDSGGISSRGSHLGADVGMADDKLEARLHEKFDHDLSKIDDDLNDQGTTDTPTVGETKASEIAEMLANPKSIRQAVILSEILNRPQV